MERVPLHDREMEISIQYHVMLIRQSNDQILMRCYIIFTILPHKVIYIIMYIIIMVSSTLLAFR